MATQYRDGTFGETKMFDQVFEEFQQACELGLAKALHVGTPEEIEEVKQEVSSKKRLDELESKLNKLEAESNRIIAVPTFHELKALGLDSAKSDLQ